MPHIFTPQFIMKINWTVNKDFDTSYGIRYEADINMASSKSSPKEIAKYIATNHPFVDGNKRTAFIIMKFDQTLEKTIKDNYDMLELLSIS